MSVTAKEIAAALQLSQTAVSMALRGKRGVSEQTRRLVLDEARRRGYDFSRLQRARASEGTIYVVLYKSSNAILSYTPIFDEYLEGVRRVLAGAKLRLKVLQLWEKTDDLEAILGDIRVSDCAGIVLIGTEITAPVCRRFTALSTPVILLDSYLEGAGCDCALIDNEAGAFRATDYLIGRYAVQPGYIRSTYRIPNFEERLVGYKKAIRDNGMSVSRCITHELTPSFDGSYADMQQILAGKEPLARAYFCENDILAIGALRALKDAGLRVPEDVALVGFDNIQEGRLVNPALSTMDVPRTYIGECAARQLLFRLSHRVPAPVRIATAPALLTRHSA